MRLIGKLALVAALAIQLGCSGMGKNELPTLSSEAQQRFSGVSIAQALETADSKLQNAYKQEMGYFAPQSLKKAERALAEAIKRAGSKEPNDVLVFTQVLAMEAALLKAETTKVMVLRELAEAFALKDDLDLVNAQAYDKRRYNGFVSDIKDLIEYIEDGKNDKARSKLPELTQALIQFEIDTIVYNTLNPAKASLADAKDADADKLAVKSFEKASALYETAEAFIRANAKQADAVQQRGLNALLEAKHAIFVARMVNSLQGIKPDKFENIVLDEERRLGRVAQALGLGPIYDRSVSDQALVLADAVIELKDRLREMEGKLKSLKAEAELSSEATHGVQQPLVESEIAENKDDVTTTPVAVDQAANTAALISREPEIQGSKSDEVNGLSNESEPLLEGLESKTDAEPMASEQVPIVDDEVSGLPSDALSDTPQNSDTPVAVEHTDANEPAQDQGTVVTQ